MPSSPLNFVVSVHCIRIKFSFPNMSFNMHRSCPTLQLPLSLPTTPLPLSQSLGLTESQSLNLFTYSLLEHYSLPSLPSSFSLFATYCRGPPLNPKSRLSHSLPWYSHGALYLIPSHRFPTPLSNGLSVFLNI